MVQLGNDRYSFHIEMYRGYFRRTRKTPDTMDNNISEFSTEDYFETQPAPSNLESELSGVQDFINRHAARRTRVVLVTVSLPRMSWHSVI